MPDMMPESIQKAILDAGITSLGALTMRLNTNPAAMDVATASIVGVTEVSSGSVSWYNGKSVTAAASYDDGTGTLTVPIQEQIWSYTGSSSPISVTGAYVTCVSGGFQTLVGASQFPVPIVMANSLNAVAASLNLTQQLMPQS